MSRLEGCLACALLQRNLGERLKPAENTVNAEIVRRRIIPMADYSDGELVPELKSTVYGIDTAIVLVVLASAGFWLSVGVVVWLFIR
jgi:hypothetical protein